MEKNENKRRHVLEEAKGTSGEKEREKEGKKETTSKHKHESLSGRRGYTEYIHSLSLSLEGMDRGE